MGAYVFDAPAHPSAPVAGSDARFPVRRIFCVGRNYADHAREMGNNPDRDPPFFFTKPADALVTGNRAIPFPPETANLHFEGELVVAIGTGGQNIDAAQALDHIWGYAPGNDLTRRDLQTDAKAARRPWDMAKGFDNSAICGDIVSVSDIGHLTSARLSTTVNGTLKQDGDIADMIWPVPETVAYLSRFVGLRPGDLIYTGTPAGVGPLTSADSCTVAVQGLGQISVSFI